MPYIASYLLASGPKGTVGICDIHIDFSAVRLTCDRARFFEAGFLGDDLVKFLYFAMISIEDG